MSAHLPRLLALVPYLLARPGVTFAEAAQVFGVTEERLRKDLNLLWVCGLPGHGPGDLIDIEFEHDTITLFEPAGVTRPLRLTVDEALALVVALRALAETPGLTDREALDRALVKVEQVAGAAAVPAGRVQVAVEGEERVLPVVEQALRAGRRLQVTYYVPGRDESTEREVDPIRVLLVDGRTYLEAWCRRAEGVRTFRLDRIKDLQVLETAATPPPVPDRDLSQGLFQPGPEDVLVVLELSPGAQWVADYYPCESVDVRPEGTTVIALRTRDTAWLQRLVLRLGGLVRVNEPEELRVAVHQAAQEALTAYGLG